MYIMYIESKQIFTIEIFWITTSGYLVSKKQGNAKTYFAVTAAVLHSDMNDICVSKHGNSENTKSYIIHLLPSTVQQDRSTWSEYDRFYIFISTYEPGIINLNETGNYSVCMKRAMFCLLCSSHNIPAPRIGQLKSYNCPAGKGKTNGKIDSRNRISRYN